MFTGIIEETSVVQDIQDAGEGKRIEIERPESFKQVSNGESICLSGACLTIETFNDTSIEFFLAEETLEKTWFSEISEGHKVNLERSLKPEDRMSGHIVQGHIDTTTKTLEVEELEEGWNFKFKKPDKIKNLLVHKGFVAVEGISLTVTDITSESFSVTVIPETWERSNLSSKKQGDFVNIEPDMMAKYVQKNLEKRT